MNAKEMAKMVMESNVGVEEKIKLLKGLLSSEADKKSSAPAEHKESRCQKVREWAGSVKWSRNAGKNRVICLQEADKLGLKFETVQAQVVRSLKKNVPGLVDSWE